MWFLGHFCVGYLVSKGVSREQIPGYMLPLLLLFSNIPDSLHIGVFRLLTHNLGGTLFVTLAALFFMRLLFVKLNKYEMLLLFTAGIFHILGDLLYGSYHPFYPITAMSPTFFDFNTATNLVTEIGLFAIVLAIMVLSKDYYRFTTWCKDVIRRAFKNDIREDSTGRVKYPILFIGGYCVMIMAQMVIFLIATFREDNPEAWYRWVELLLFVTMLTLPFHGFFMKDKPELKPPGQVPSTYI